MTEEPKDPKAAGDKPASETPGEPLKGEVSRTDSPGAGVSAAPAAPVARRRASLRARRHGDKPAAPAPRSLPRKTCGCKTRRALRTTPSPRRPRARPIRRRPPAPTFRRSSPRCKPPFPVRSTQVSFYVGDWTVIVPATKLLEVGRFLRETPEAGFDFCSDVTASDWPTRPQRFDVIYCLFSTRHRKRVRVKVRAAESEPVPSVSGIWPAANWLEREVYDLFGVNFTGHPNRKRILMPDDWQGHPQRKDYPLEGPGELLMENPLDWLKLKQAREEAEIE